MKIYKIWKDVSSPPHRQFRAVMSVMATAFWNSERIVGY